MSKKVLGDFDFKYNNPKANGNLNGAMGNDIVDFFSNVLNKATTTQASTTTTAPVTTAPTAKATNDKMMTYLKYGAMAVGGVALVIVIMKMMKKKKA
jgi:2-keto-3-deoxy-6-phosphogluconate aldolase